MQSLNMSSRRCAHGVEGRRPCCLSAVAFRPALPAPDQELSPHPAVQLRLLRAFSHILHAFGSESRVLSLWFCLCPESLNPLPLCRAFPDSLDGRDSVAYYGSAAPLLALATSPPPLYREPWRFRRCSHSTFSVSRRCPAVTLQTCAQAREAEPPRYGVLAAPLPPPRGWGMFGRGITAMVPLGLASYHPIRHLFIGLMAAR
jgi:hypothetical protein